MRQERGHCSPLNPPLLLLQIKCRSGQEYVAIPFALCLVILERCMRISHARCRQGRLRKFDGYIHACPESFLTYVPCNTLGNFLHRFLYPGPSHCPHEPALRMLQYGYIVGYQQCYKYSLNV